MLDRTASLVSWRIVDIEFLDTRSTTGFVNQRSDAEISRVVRQNSGRL